MPVSAGDPDRLQHLLTEPLVRRHLCDDQVLSRDQVSALLGAAIKAGNDGLGRRPIRQGGVGLGYIGLLPVSDEAAALRPGFAGAIEPIIAPHPSR